jgi:hypothetical protein
MKMALLFLVLTTYTISKESKTCIKLIIENNQEIEQLRVQRLQSKMGFCLGALLVATATFDAYLAYNHEGSAQTLAVQSYLLRLSLQQAAMGFAGMQIGTYGYFKAQYPLETLKQAQKRLFA